uniref:Secreted protein n=1 Tax=Panagrellus redivivus TaxID=6233 RepID=A0A7E4VQ20_PANRE
MPGIHSQLVKHLTQVIDLTMRLLTRASLPLAMVAAVRTIRKANTRSNFMMTQTVTVVDELLVETSPFVWINPITFVGLFVGLRNQCVWVYVA